MSSTCNSTCNFSRDSNSAALASKWYASSEDASSDSENPPSSLAIISATVSGSLALNLRLSRPNRQAATPSASEVRAPGTAATAPTNSPPRTRHARSRTREISRSSSASGTSSAPVKVNVAVSTPSAASGPDASAPASARLSTFFRFGSAARACSAEGRACAAILPTRSTNDMARTRVRSTRHFEAGERTRGESSRASSRAAVAPETGDAGSAVFPGEGTDGGGSDEPTRGGSFSAFAASDADATGASGVVAVASEAFVASRAASEVPASLRSAFPVIVSIASSSGYAGARRTRRPLAAARERRALRERRRGFSATRARTCRDEESLVGQTVFLPRVCGKAGRGYVLNGTSSRVDETIRESQRVRNLPRRRRRDDG